ncbi:hypothetical protein CsSME_00046909 [Camellia sinensis var. sinensis]
MAPYSLFFSSFFSPSPPPLSLSSPNTTTTTTISPTQSPSSSPSPPSIPSSSSTLDPKQLTALQSLNIPTSTVSCSQPPSLHSATVCDAAKPLPPSSSQTAPPTSLSPSPPYLLSPPSPPSNSSTLPSFLSKSNWVFAKTLAFEPYPH